MNPLFSTGRALAIALALPAAAFAEERRPPQFVVFSFDGSLALDRWEDTLRFARELRARQAPGFGFTYFVSGVYFLAPENKTIYHGPRHRVGSATLKALRDLAAGAHWALAGARGEFASGSGAAMRAAPLSFFLDPSVEADRRTIRDVSRITHHSDEAYAGALAVIVALRHCASNGTVPQDLLSVVAAVLPDTAVRDHLLDIANFRGSPSEAAVRFGCSGHVVEAVPMALFVAAATTDEPIGAVIATAVSLGGDTDTIAAIGAQIAAVGGRPLPDELVARLPELPQITPVLNQLVSLLK